MKSVIVSINSFVVDSKRFLFRLNKALKSFDFPPVEKIELKKENASKKPKSRAAIYYARPILDLMPRSLRRVLKNLIAPLFYSDFGKITNFNEYAALLNDSDRLKLERLIRQDQLIGKLTV